MKPCIKYLCILFFIVINGCQKTAHNNKKYTIGFSQFTTKDEWRKAMIQSMEIEAQFYNEVELLVLDGKGSVDRQIEDVSELITKKVDVLIVSPIAPKPLKGVINNAIKAGIPVIILDREIADVPYQSFIGVDNYDVGINAAKYLKSLKSQGNIIEIKGWAGTTPTKQRSIGFNTIINTIDNLKIVDVVQERYDEPGIKTYFKKVLENNKDINFVFAHKDNLALEAYEVARELGREKELIFVGVGGVNSENGGVGLIEKKILKASILHPTGGKEAIATAMKIINKQKSKKEILLPSLVIDKDNVDVVKRQATLILNQELDIEKQQAKIKEQYQLFSSQSVFLRYTIFSLFLIASLFVLTFFTKTKLTKQKKVIEETLETVALQKSDIEKKAKELKLLNEATNNFFTGVSHDFKTPISLILSSTESLLTANNTKKPEEYSFIYNNSKRLLRMVNELLDFKKIENQKIRLQVIKTNINEFVAAIYNDFKNEAINRNIDFSFHKNAKEVSLFIDREIFDNVLFNLLSNAFKFTPRGGKITMNIDEVAKGVFISVKDSGIGVLETEKDKIFNQFFQGTNNKQTSSGIGLYVVKEYIKSHFGSIELISSKGNGAEFKIYIPKGKDHFKPNEVLVEDSLSIHHKDIITVNTFDFNKQKEETNKVNDGEKETLLIIEDNTDLRYFLNSKLSKKYKVFESDGIGAVKKAIDVVPDIIISDVNLPEKNGFEITEILKYDERTSHIPIILLTALSSNEAHIKGLESGVDMFLTKPFNLSILHQSLKTLLYNRNRLQLHYKHIFSTEKIEKENLCPKKVENKDIESEFFNRINTIVLKNLDDSSFTVELLAEELKISRVQLYRKTKAVLGMNISDYILNIRLEKSKELLKNSKMTIAAIAYSIGFSSPNYFSTSFKNKYGKTPKKFQKDSFKNVT